MHTHTKYTPYPTVKLENHWNAESYTKHALFVSTLALPVVELLDPKKGEIILDLGCGEGTLACEIQNGMTPKE